MADDRQREQAQLPGDTPLYAHYEHSFVAFLDILGFTTMVRQLKNESHFEHISRILYALKKDAESFSRAQESFAKDVEMTAVSDSVVITMPYRNPVSLYMVLMLMLQLQYAMLVEGNTPLRGYLAQGHVYHRNGILFGPGYLDAYDGESKNGGPPRIVVAPAIAARAVELTVQAYGDGRHSVIDFLRRDSDGQYFVDYLKPVGTLQSESQSNRVQELGKVAQFAREQIEAHFSNAGVQAKYQWLVGYVDTIRREFYP